MNVRLYTRPGQETHQVCVRCRGSPSNAKEVMHAIRVDRKYFIYVITFHRKYLCNYIL